MVKRHCEKCLKYRWAQQDFKVCARCADGNRPNRQRVVGGFRRTKKRRGIMLKRTVTPTKGKKSKGKRGQKGAE
jgi:hypothetical protein